jgi:hypothetical protein
MAVTPSRLEDAKYAPFPNGCHQEPARAICPQSDASDDRYWTWKALAGMHRVLRPDGRLVLTIDKQADKWGRSGEVDAMGQWQWSVDDARRMMEVAGFTDVSIADMPTRLGLQFVRGAKRAAAPSVAEAVETPVLMTGPCDEHGDVDGSRRSRPSRSAPPLRRDSMGGTGRPVGRYDEPCP